MADQNAMLAHGARSAHRTLLELSKEPEKETDELVCPAFGFLRGIRDRALAVELRFRDGNSDWFAYSLLASWRHDPSVGLLLKFSGGDVITLVLIRGSNLNAVVKDRETNLTDRGLQRHKVTFIREMGEDESRQAEEGQPTIDQIEVAEFESNEEAQGWLQKSAPQFVRK